MPSSDGTTNVATVTTLAASSQSPVLITGAAGTIGRMVRPRLASLGWELHSLDREPDGDPDISSIDVLDGAALDAATVGCGAVIHLAGIPHEAPLPQILEANVQGTQAVLDAALRRGIQRVVLASSCHAVGFWERTAGGSDLGVDVRPRPDTFYGVAKVALEALGQLYSDRFGLEVVSLRIGACKDKPANRRELSTWLSPGDAARLMDASLRGPVRGHVIAYGVSANTRGWWDLSTARAMGYQPQDDSEAFAEEIPPETSRRSRTGEQPPPAPERVGGPFTSLPLGGLTRSFQN
ncbi:NAD(P)-dependent oxidoreductase [Kineosporia mesophila]|uniref:NAD(P)-dependent oxidoreductase n=1 Tax=Kineosporia mesophila TaxID=566012 RepID=A0ABP6ZR11_9ACTN|nr:NAD(P)-dependent oxidoreductase [Kineosporia mesophila]